MDWRDEGVLLAVRRHGESAAIIEVFTAQYGRQAGVVRGGASRKMTPVLQLGAQLDVTWRARLEAHLGAFTVEPLKGRAADVLSDRLALSGLSAVCALLAFSLPERQAHPNLYAHSIALLDAIGAEGWERAYLQWEVALLEEMGFALDLSVCAVTGSTEDLIYVSPKSGRAVSRTGAGDWADRLLPLPECLRSPGPALRQDVLAGLKTTGYFLHSHLAQSLGERPLPKARQRLIDVLVRQSAS